MCRLDYGCNNLGWGIEWSAIAYADTHDLLVLRDLGVRVRHRRGTDYSHQPPQATGN